MLGSGILSLLSAVKMCSASTRMFSDFVQSSTARQQTGQPLCREMPLTCSPVCFSSQHIWIHPYLLPSCWDNMQSLASSYTEFIFCLGAASSDSGLNFQMCVTIWTDFKAIVCEWERERENIIWLKSFFVLNRGFGTLFFVSWLLLYCSGKWCTECKTQINPNWCGLSPMGRF